MYYFFIELELTEIYQKGFIFDKKLYEKNIVKK